MNDAQSIQRVLNYSHCDNSINGISLTLKKKDINAQIYMSFKPFASLLYLAIFLTCNQMKTLKVSISCLQSMGIMQQ
jgi:hypothetical protein